MQQTPIIPDPRTCSYDDYCEAIDRYNEWSGADEDDDCFDAYKRERDLEDSWISKE